MFRAVVVDSSMELSVVLSLQCSGFSTCNGLWSNVCSCCCYCCCGDYLICSSPFLFSTERGRGRLLVCPIPSLFLLSIEFLSTFCWNFVIVFFLYYPLSFKRVSSDKSRISGFTWRNRDRLMRGAVITNAGGRAREFELKSSPKKSKSIANECDQLESGQRVEEGGWTKDRRGRERSNGR